MANDRTMKLGLLSEKRTALLELKVYIDTIWKGIITHVDFIDVDMEYVEKINPIRLKILMKDLEVKVKEYKKVRSDIANIKGEIGENGLSD
jgi:hypothetical protein